MLHDPARHEPLQDLEWDERAAVRTIERIARDTEERFSPESHWPLHPLDADGGRMEPKFHLYSGAAGVVWALHYLQAVGAVRLRRTYVEYVDALLPLNRAHLRSADTASFLVGDTGILLLSYWLRPSTETAARLEELITSNLDHPARELMLGAPGTMLAALFLHGRTGEPRWVDIYVATARKLWSQLLWSPEFRCRYWSQDLFGYRSTHLGGVHGFAATAAPLILGRHLLSAGEWDAWQQCIVETIGSAARRDGNQANWPPYLHAHGGSTRPQKPLMQFCHGAPGIVICLADLPPGALDADLLAGAEAIWRAGPLTKGSNLCHGTGGNGYAFLALYRRTKDERWLARARSFAMHGIAQTEAHARQYGQVRYSLWTGDLGFAIYLRDCLGGDGTFPILETFFAPAK